MNQKLKVIQICVDGGSDDTPSSLFALLDDGRIFMKENVGYSSEKSWKEIEPIPPEREKP